MSVVVEGRWRIFATRVHDGRVPRVPQPEIEQRSLSRDVGSSGRSRRGSIGGRGPNTVFAYRLSIEPIGRGSVGAPIIVSVCAARTSSAGGVLGRGVIFDFRIVRATHDSSDTTANRFLPTRERV